MVICSFCQFKAALTRLNDPMPMLMPPLKWICVLFCFSVSVVTLAKAWQSLVRQTRSHFQICFKYNKISYYYFVHSPNVCVKELCPPTKASFEPLTCKSDNCSGSSFLLWWSWWDSRPGRSELLSAEELRRSIVLHAFPLSTRTSSCWVKITVSVKWLFCNLNICLHKVTRGRKIHNQWSMIKTATNCTANF